MMALMTAFQLIQSIYWLALATWFGAVLFIAIAAPVIFRSVREANPTLPDVRSDRLAGEHGSLLAGTIVGNILRTLGTVQLVCAGLVLVALVGQWLKLDLGSPRNVGHALIRSAMYVAAVVLVGYDRWLVWPRAWKFRQEYIDHADEPEIADAARERFDRYHRESVRVLAIELAALSLMIVFSSWITPAVL